MAAMLLKRDAWALVDIVAGVLLPQMNIELSCRDKLEWLRSRLASRITGIIPGNNL